MTSILPGPISISRPLREAGAPPPQAFRVVVVEHADALSAHIDAWEDLSRECVEPNVFYEPWLFLPALRHLGPFPSARFVLLFAPCISEPGREVLCGFFPLQRCSTETVVPLSATGLLRHAFCYLRTPLLRACYARECLTAFFDWFLKLPGDASLLELGDIPGAGAFRALLTDELFRRGTLTFTVSSYTRALFRLGTSAERYLNHALSSRHRREFGRKARRLADHGRLAYEYIDRAADIDAWIDSFLKLEASGWKGRGETAMLSRPETQAFFQEIVRAAFERNRLRMLRLTVGGRPCASRVGFLCGTGAMAFKTAFDEEFAKSSPGMLLEIENVRRMHEDRSVEWIDSGADPRSQLFNQVWLHRRAIDTLLVAGGGFKGALLVSVLPLARLANRIFQARGLRLKVPQPADEPNDP